MVERVLVNIFIGIDDIIIWRLFSGFRIELVKELKLIFFFI